MELVIEQREGIKLVKLQGRLDATNSQEIQEKLMAELDSESRIIFDMANCEYISSAGLRVLLVIAKKLKSLGGHGVYANLLKEVKDVMEMTGFSHILSSFATTEEAIQHLKEEV